MANEPLNMQGLRQLQSTAEVMSMVQLIDNWKEVKKLLTNYSMFIEEYQDKITELNKQVAEFQKERELFEKETADKIAEIEVRSEAVDKLVNATKNRDRESLKKYEENCRETERLAELSAKIKEDREVLDDVRKEMAANHAAAYDARKEAEALRDDLNRRLDLIRKVGEAE